MTDKNDVDDADDVDEGLTRVSGHFREVQAANEITPTFLNLELACCEGIWRTHSHNDDL